MESNLHIMVGLPASGKSTYVGCWASPFDAVASCDVFSAELRQTLKSNEYFPVPANQEYNLWMDYLVNRADDAFFLQSDLWIDQTTLSIGSAMKLLRTFNSRVNIYDHFHMVIFEHMCTPSSVCLKRNSRRVGWACVPDETMQSMIESFNFNIEEVRKQAATIDTRLPLILAHHCITE